MLLPYNRKSDHYEEKLDKITHGLKNLARELEIPIILTVKLLSFNHDSNDDPHPKLADLQLYGALSKDTTVVMALHRPDFYKCDEAISSSPNITELLIQKNAHERIGIAKIYFHPEKFKFVPFEETI